MALVLHGGRPDGHQEAGGFLLSHVRMVPFGQAIARSGADRGVETALLRYRVRGWNEPGLDPVRDARWALDDVRRRHGDDVRVATTTDVEGSVVARAGGDAQEVTVSPDRSTRVAADDGQAAVLRAEDDLAPGLVASRSASPAAKASGSPPTSGWWARTNARTARRVSGSCCTVVTRPPRVRPRRPR